MSVCFCHMYMQPPKKLQEKWYIIISILFQSVENLYRDMRQIERNGRKESVVLSYLYSEVQYHAKMLPQFAFRRKLNGDTHPPPQTGILMNPGFFTAPSCELFSLLICKPPQVSLSLMSLHPFLLLLLGQLVQWKLDYAVHAVPKILCLWVH